jgi:hypothetical protein
LNETFRRERKAEKLARRSERKAAREEAYLGHTVDVEPTESMAVEHAAE